jgi:hypothetical protein
LVKRGVRGSSPFVGADLSTRPSREDLIEGTGELGVTVSDEETEGADPVPQIHDEVACLLGGPRSGRVGSDSQDVHAAGFTSTTNKTYNRFNTIVST